MKRNRKSIIITIVLVLILSIGTVSATINPVSIFIDGNQIQSDIEPIIIDGRTMVPLRFIAENFGATVEWDENTNSVIITSASYEGNESGATHPEGSEGYSENDEGESGDPSSPILQLDESWDGVVNGIRTNMQYDQAKGRFYGIVENVTDQVINGILIELNLKSGAKTVVELGPEPVGDLQPGEKVTVELLVSKEPEAKGVQFDAWEIHPEAEGQGKETGEGVEGSGEAGESHSGEGSESGEEGMSTGAMTLAKNETYDVTKNGARLVLQYNSSKKAFEGTLQNVGNQVLTRARVEIHLNNGTELGPTTPVNLAVGENINLSLPTNESFNTWVTHAEFGNGENGENAESGTSTESGESSGGSREGTSESKESGESHGSEGSEGRND
ncbi:copper amine oxidase N-terminal domain-containing protein [Vallitalea okinawensis]|uniref:copper amine oxidase N-terminal domain-containing protein n=1 Tax=Vallitalea okinawensis TaxID=2078660 RepID=UPI000CFAA7F3|nr:copper amine oxidase N-terminal domain-containing protein [Vallitalea okinawensis]